MTRRTTATVLAGTLTGGLLLCAFALPVHYVHLQPGSTVDLLAESGSQERIRVEGRETYDDPGQLHMTTVVATPPEHDITLAEAMAAWVDGDDAVVPYEAIYEEGETEESSDEEAQLQMASSRDDAVAAALRHLGHDVPEGWRVAEIVRGSPADGALALDDVITRVGDTPTPAWEDVVEAIRSHRPGDRVELRVRRDRSTYDIPVRLGDSHGVAFLGIEAQRFYTFPFDVEIDVPEHIGGPSAGLMFSLAIIDTLTPGPLADGAVVAGTGTIDDEGNVGPIGGIEQKIAASRDIGAELFLAPAANCTAAVDAPSGDMRVVAVSTLDEAVQALEDHAGGRDDLPTCEAVLEAQE